MTQESSIIREEKLFGLSAGEENFPYLIGKRCKGCGEFLFPPLSICKKCLSDQLHEVHFGREGKLYSYSIVRFAPQGFKGPYAIGYIDLEGGLRLFSMICDWEESELVTGKDMELVITNIRSDEKGDAVLGYAYRPKRT